MPELDDAEAADDSSRETGKARTKPDQSLEDQIVAAIRRIIRAVDLHSHWLHGKYRLTGPQLFGLQEIARAGPYSVVGLARSLGLSQPTVSGIVERLDRAGLIERAPNGRDRRGVILSATEKGLALLASAPPLLQDRFRQELHKLRLWERTQILATLQRIAAMMDMQRREVGAAHSEGAAADRTTLR